MESIQYPLFYEDPEYNHVLGCLKHLYIRYFSGVVEKNGGRFLTYTDPVFMMEYRDLDFNYAYISERD